MTERLTSLAILKDWLDIDNTDNDTDLTRLIDAASQFTLSYLNRDSLQSQSYTENFRGNCKCSTLLKNWPIRSVTQVGINGQLIPASTFGQGGKPNDGYTISDRRNSPQSIDLWGAWRYYGPCQIVYVAGYETTQEQLIPAAVAPATNPVILPQNSGVWSADVGVTINGTAATKVTSNPTTGQYEVDAWGNYTFAVADVGKDVVITYSYTPWDLSQGVVELISNWWKRKDRIGILSKTLAGQETITFSPKDFNDTIQRTLQNYKSEIPV